MKVINLNYNSVIEEENLILVCGFFDGLHIAHMKLIEKALELKKEFGNNIGVLTLSTNTKYFIKNEPWVPTHSLDIY